MFKKRSGGNKHLQFNSEQPTATPPIQDEQLDIQGVFEAYRHQVIIEDDASGGNAIEIAKIEDSKGDARKRVKLVAQQVKQVRMEEQNEVQKELIDCDQQHHTKHHEHFNQEEGILQIEEDFGENSDSSNEYEEQIIKRTLTKHNFEKINNRAKPKREERLIKEIVGKSSLAIRRNIARDIHNKKAEIDNLKGEMDHLGRRGAARRDVMGIKLEGISKLDKEWDQMKIVLERIYFAGDKLRNFSKEAIIAAVL